MSPPASARPVPGRRPRVGSRGLLLLGLVAAAGCGVLGPQPLDVPPGQRVVIGRLDLNRFDRSEALVDLIRADGTFGVSLGVQGARDFVVTLPPGPYEVRHVRLVDARATSPDHPRRDIRVRFDVGDAPVVYVGTLRLITRFPPRVEVEVVDEFERTVPAVRARHPELAEPVRSLFRPS